jgi:aspartate dehydrogenase
MAKLLKVGIVGCGAIGSSLAKTIVKNFSVQAKLVALFDIDTRKSQDLSRRVSRYKGLAVAELGQLIRKSELVIEAASAKSSWEIAGKVLSQGRDIMLMSVGGIVSRSKELSALAKKYNARVYIPSGAISGVDALKAANLGKIKRVTLTTRKNPVSFRGVRYIEKKGIDLKRIKNERILFSGSAKDAVKYFPQNINVAAILSLAGLGENKTQVRIVASPDVKKNIHEIQVESGAARIFTRTENILHPDNPKTSYLAVLSAVATLKQILEPVRIGT